MLYADNRLWKIVGKRAWKPLLLAVLLAVGRPGGAQKITNAQKLTEQKLAETPRLRLNTGGHIAAVHSLLFTDDQKLISCGLDKVVRVSALNTDKVDTWRYEIGDGFIGQFFAAALNPNVPHQLAVGSSGAGISQDVSKTSRANDSDILLTDYVTGKQTNRLKGHKGTITGLAFAPRVNKVNLLASCGTDGKLCLWDLTAPKPKPQIKVNDGEYMTGVAFSPDGHWCAASSWRVDEDEHPGTVRVWAVSGKHFEGKPRVFPWRNELLCVGWGKNNVLACGSVDGVIRLWDAPGDVHAKFKERKPLAVQNDSISCLAFSQDGTRLLTGGGREGHDVTARIWSLSQHAQVQEFTRHNTTIHSVAFSPDSPDGTLAASGDAFGAVYVWKVKPESVPDTGKNNDWGRQDDDVIRSFKGPGNPVFSVQWSKSGDRVAWGSEFGRDVREHVFNLTKAAPDMDTGDNSSEWTGAATNWENPKKPSEFFMLRPLLDGSALLVCDAAGREKRRIKMEPADKLHCFGFTPDGKVVVGSDLYLAQYDIHSHVQRDWIFEGHEGPILTLAVSPDGRYLASGSVDQTVRLWNLRPTSDDIDSAPEDRSTGSAHTPTASPNSGGWQEMDARGTAVALPEARLRAVAPLMGVFEGEGGVWAAWAQKGYYTASATGDDLLGWHINKGGENAAEFRTSYQCREWFYKPEVIRQLALQGDLSKALKVAFNGAIPPGLDTPIQQRIARVPQLIDMSVVPGNAPPERDPTKDTTLKPDSAGVFTATSEQVTAYLSFQTPDPELKIGEVALNHPGARPASIPDTGKSRGWGASEDLHKGKWKISVPALVKGKNEVRIVARNDSGSMDISLHIRYEPPAHKPGTLRVFAVGISRYNDARLNLQYADKDAQAMLDFFQANGKSQFSDVKLYPLLNQDATYDRIRTGLQQLAHDVQPEDTALLFFACHGFIAGDAGSEQFFLAPADTNFEQPNNPGKGVAWKKIISSLTGMQAQHIVLMVDHCFAGGVNKTLVQTAVGARAQAQSHTLRDMRSNNLFVFSASGPTEFSYEDSALQHGVFTAAILEALQGGMEPSQYREEGTAFLDALGYWVPQRVKYLNRDKPRAQHPSLFALPNAFEEVPLTKVPPNKPPANP